ncbi:MAG: hypothetical protein KKD25_03385 [Gammaproteobacteria bacterium]|nr:hypothetical protein [Gammaproteobacteria bacterium]MBU0771984.1 hypothetical protein [Gammaproteobacteria bacterium]MBU0857842.1 hypothetical protein [Gammaproteobacteria bacterium]MBU1845745.1 hypothetical protein [Gammaproteobacteria bacterium]
MASADSEAGDTGKLRCGDAICARGLFRHILSRSGESGRRQREWGGRADICRPGDLTPLLYDVPIMDTSPALRRAIGRRLVSIAIGGRRMRNISIAAAILFSLSCNAQAAVSYSVTDVGVSDGVGMSTGLSLNTSGMVVVTTPYFDTVDLRFRMRSFVSSGGIASVLETPAGLDFQVTGIADNGVIGGSVGIDDFRSLPGMWSGSELRYLPLPASQDPDWMAVGHVTGMNRHGDMVGASYLSSVHASEVSAEQVALVWRQGELEVLAAPSFHTIRTFDISDSGVVSALAFADGAGAGAGNPHLVTWDGDGTFADLGEVPAFAQWNSASASGRMVGVGPYADGGMDAGPFVFDPDGVHALPVLPDSVDTWAGDINNAGVIVGDAYIGESEEQIAVIWLGGEILDLNSLIDPASGWTLIDAQAINERGQIAALARNAAGEMRAVLLAPVPEPAVWGTMLGGLALVGLVARRRAAKSPRPAAFA